MLTLCHFYACEGYFGAKRVARKMLECISFIDQLYFEIKCDTNRKLVNLSRRNKIPQNPIIFSNEVLFFIFYFLCLLTK